MSKEIIKEEFIKEVEQLIKSTKDPIYKLKGLEQLKAKQSHLDNFNAFAGELNKRLNELVTKHNLEFKSLEESQVFLDYMTPTFNTMYTKYLEGIVDPKQ